MTTDDDLPELDILSGIIPDGVQVKHYLCGEVIMVLKDRPRAGSTLSACHISWPTHTADDEFVLCLHCESRVDERDLVVVGGFAS